MKKRNWLLFLMGRDQRFQENREIIAYWDRIVIIVAIVAVTVAVFLVPGTYTLGNTVEGFILLMSLYAADRPDESLYECISFSGAWALCIILIVGIVLVNPIILWVAPNIANHLASGEAKDIVAEQIIDGYFFILMLLLGIPMTRYRSRLLAERQKKEASEKARQERQQALSLQSSATTAQKHTKGNKGSHAH